MRILSIALLALFLAACESNPPAPVIDHAPQTKPAPPAPKPVSSKPAEAKPTTNKDWRPDSYIVKKGDTLFSIALQFGYDYKEIAAANNIAEPYPIRIGQKLSFTSLNAKVPPTEGKPAAAESDDGVIVSPIKTESAGTPSATAIKPAPSAVTPVLSEPKAMREAYSLEALNRKSALISAKPNDAKPADANPTDIKTADEENLNWAWPTQGRVMANFNEASNKGIDIGGSLGQSINAAASGKVIYAGSDLRGYGKLVIIKHNKIFLSVYAHNSKIIVKEGQTIAAGQKIAEMGNTDANAVKLHFEIRHQGKSVDPMKYMPQF